MLGPLTYLDVALIALCIISGFLAMYRGLTREILSIVSWALAAAATLYVVTYQRALADELSEQFFQSKTLALIAMGTVVFVVVLIVVHFITVRFSDSVLDSRVGLIDRILGFAFGLARGFLLVVIAYLFFDFVAQERTHPIWIKQAQSLPLIKSTGNTVLAILKSVVPQELSIPGAEDESKQQSRTIDKGHGQRFVLRGPATEWSTNVPIRVDLALLQPRAQHSD